MPGQATEEEAEKKEVNKDLTAITQLLSASRAASLALKKLDHTAELQADLKEKTQKVKEHQDVLETKVFSKELPV